MFKDIDWGKFKTTIMIIGGVSAILALLETTGTRWWIYRFEFLAYAQEVDEQYVTVAEAQSVLDRRLKSVEQRSLTRDQASIAIQLREVQTQRALSDTPLLRQIEENLERQLHEVTRELDRFDS